MKSAKDTIVKLNNRDSNALKEFFISFYPSLCVFAKKYISETDLMEDIAQEAFLVFWENNKQFENIEAIKGFLYSTVRNKCLNHIKLKSLHEETHRRELFNEVLFNEFVIEEETYRIIYEAIKNLPPQSKNIIELSMKGLKNPEIANELQVSVNTVKTLKKNAYKFLRIQLKDHVFVLLMLSQILNN